MTYERNGHGAYAHAGGNSNSSNSSNNNGSTPRMRQLLLDAVYEASAAVTQGVLCNTTYLPPPPPTSSSLTSFSAAAPTTSAADNTSGGSEHNNSSSGGGDDVATGTMGYVTAATRQQYLADGTRHVRQLLDEYEALMLRTVERDALRPVAASTAAAALLTTTSSSIDGDNNNNDAAAAATTRAARQSVVALRARANAKLFAEACKLTVPLSEYRLPDSNNNNNNCNSSSSAGEQQGDVQRLRPLTQLLQQVRDVRRCAGYKHEEYLQHVRAKLAKEDAAAAADEDDYMSSNNNNSSSSSSSSAAARNSAAATPHHIPALVRRLEEALETCLDLLRERSSNSNGNSESYAACASSAALISGMATWPQNLLRIVNEAVQNDTLESRVEGVREQLRRARFDVEELQLQQEQAVTDGDMHRSEELYFQQVAVLEAMTPHFDALEDAVQHYRADCGDAVRARLGEFAQSFRPTVQGAVAVESALRRRMHEDVASLQGARAAVTRARAAQRTAAQVYTNEWRRVYEDNVKQQAACLRAMDELERRLRGLGEEAAWLVRDRAAHVQRERAREEDALALTHFADERTAALQRSLHHVDTAMRALQTMGDAVEAACERLDAYVREAVQAHADDALLRARKQRLTQFRTLYLTLGDLQFKKARHAEEVEKKIEYYTLQQEIAMDALNPKAKEYSQAKRQWQAVEQEMQEQLHALEQRSARQLADFHATEVHLIEAGVSFTHPQDELAERNFSRTQKLLEYKKLMESKAEEAKRTTGNAARRGNDGAGDGDDADDEDEEEEERLAGGKRAMMNTTMTRRGHGGSTSNTDNYSGNSSNSGGDRAAAAAAAAARHAALEEELTRYRRAQTHGYTSKYNNDDDNSSSVDDNSDEDSGRHTMGDKSSVDDAWRRAMARNAVGNGSEVTRLRSTEDGDGRRGAMPPSTVRSGGDVGGSGGRRR